MNEILPSTEFTYGKCDGNKNDAFGACTSQSQGLEMVAQKYDACLHPVPVTPTANINSEYFCKTVNNFSSEIQDSLSGQFSYENCKKLFSNCSELENHNNLYNYDCDVCGICYESNLHANLHKLEIHPFSFDAGHVPVEEKTQFALGARAPT